MKPHAQSYATPQAVTTTSCTSFSKLASMRCSKLMVHPVIRYIRWLPASSPLHLLFQISKAGIAVSSSFVTFSTAAPATRQGHFKHLALQRRRPPRSTTSSRLSQTWQTWRVTRQSLSCFCWSSLLLQLLLVSVFSTSVFLLVLFACGHLMWFSPSYHLKTHQVTTCKQPDSDSELRSEYSNHLWEVVFVGSLCLCVFHLMHCKTFDCRWAPI